MSGERGGSGGGRGRVERTALDTMDGLHKALALCLVGAMRYKTKAEGTVEGMILRGFKTGASRRKVVKCDNMSEGAVFSL